MHSLSYSHLLYHSFIQSVTQSVGGQSSIHLSPAVPAGRQSVGSFHVPPCPALRGAPWGMEKTDRRATRQGRPRPRHGSQVGCGLLATAGLRQQADPEHCRPRRPAGVGPGPAELGRVGAGRRAEGQRSLPPHQRGALCRDPRDCPHPPVHTFSATCPPSNRNCPRRPEV